MISKLSMRTSFIVWVGIAALSCVTHAANTTPTAQTADKIRFSGRVLDAKTKTPLPGANVYLPALQSGAAADHEGKFNMPALPSGTYLLRCTYIGYEKLEVTINLTVDREKDLHLQPTTLEGEAVTVISKRDQLTESKQALTVLDSKTLEKSRGQTLSESLKEIPVHPTKAYFDSWSA